MEKTKVGGREFSFRKLTRKDRKELLKEGIDINLLEVAQFDEAVDRIFGLCITGKKDLQATENLSIGEEEELLQKIVKVSRGELSESEKN